MRPGFPRPASFRLPAVLLLALCAGSARSAPMDVLLSFGTLPSAQGWSYVPSGAHAGVLEGTIFSVSGGVLTQNSMGQSNGVSGGSIFYQILNGITTTETKRLFVRARCITQEGSANATLGQGGFIFGFATGSVQYAFGLTNTRLSVLQPSGTVMLSGTYDNATAYHDYNFLWSPGGAWQLYRDNVLAGSGSGGFAVAADRVFFGDGTGGANAFGQVSYFRFTQDLATTSEHSTWGRVKRLYR